MMIPSEKEDNTKKTDLQPEPLCLFCFPEEQTFGRKTYVGALAGEPDVRGFKGREVKVKGSNQKLQEREKEKEEMWLRKRTEARIRRRRMKDPIRNLRSYLLTSVRNEKGPPKGDLPSLFEVLETVKDAWPSPSSVNIRRHEDPTKKKQQDPKSKMKDEQVKLQLPCPLLNRRLSMPEELMRKYSVKEKTSEESETNKTAIEISPSSSSTMETARRREPDGGERKVTEPEKARTTDAYQQTTTDFDPGNPQKTDLPKRVTQDDYYKHGTKIIKVRATEKDKCTCQSSTTASAKEETDESGTTESIPSSSPTQLPKRESSSGNLSSESDNLRCTCTELSSKETSTDLYLSGKSTLSQTVSDKSISTQDSTVSINSVSSRGSTASGNSNSTTPELERTSAKETTTSPDYSPRTPRNRKNRRRDRHLECYHSKTCPKHSRSYVSANCSKQCPIHSDKPQEHPKTTTDAATNTDHQEESMTQTKETTKEVADFSQNKQRETIQPTISEEKTEPRPLEERYKWAKLSQEELYMMQQLRHRKFVESQRKVSHPLPPTPDTDSISACGTGTTYPETEQIDQPIMIPRYSALPRTLSMLVNTSSPEVSNNSDSDSLADSLEDQPVTHVHKLYFDTKRESKPVRGDVSIVQDNKQKQRQPRGRAFFVSIKEPYGEDEMLESIDKIPQPPEKIKNQIHERHLNLCAKHKHLHEMDKPKDKNEMGVKKRKPKNRNEETEKHKKNLQEEGKNRKAKRFDDDKAKPEKQEAVVRKKKEAKDSQKRSGSKIPVLVSSQSTSSPERDSEAKEKPSRPKIRVRREKESDAVENAPKQTEVERTQIMEITQTGAELSLQKPQAVIHPSVEAKPGLTMPPLAPSLRLPPPPRQTWNKQFLLAPARRSPIGKFRQRFEVIPEEKSSSLSSADEKNGRGTLPKFADASTSPLPSDKIQVQSYNVNEVPNLIVAKITNKQLETLPYVRGNDNQKIILFSSKPQNSNSSKGRDALIAMNRDDFNRLAKGWMSFYKLSENTENSENEEKLLTLKDEKVGNDKQNNTKAAEKGQSEQPKQKENSCLGQSKRQQDEPELSDNLRFDCSNTILRKSHSEDSCRSIKKENSLPELKLSSQRNSETNKPSSGALPGDEKYEEDDSDSDSTDYMEPPSPRVPPLPIDGIASDATLSSSDDEFEDPKPTNLKYIHFKKRATTNRVKPKKENSFETSRFGKKKNTGWSVTVAGTVELSRSAPDLEMRLSFPTNGKPPLVSQSDSGFADESNYSRLSESLQDLDLYTSRKELPLGSGNMKQKWTVTVKNPEKGDRLDPNKQFPNHHLPELESENRNSKKVLKQDVKLEGRVKRLVERKMRAIWPKVQKVIRQEFLTESGRSITELEDFFEEGTCLSVRGSAVSLERKQKPPTMTERDVTRRYTSRTNE